MSVSERVEHRVSERCCESHHAVAGTYDDRDQIVVELRRVFSNVVRDSLDRDLFSKVTREEEIR